MTLEYPKWKHHATLPSRMVHDPDQEAALGPEWTSHRQQPMHPGAPRCPNCDRVEAKLLEHTDKFTHKYGETLGEITRLQAELAAEKAKNASLTEQLLDAQIATAAAEKNHRKKS